MNTPLSLSFLLPALNLTLTGPETHPLASSVASNTWSSQVGAVLSTLTLTSHSFVFPDLSVIWISDLLVVAVNVWVNLFLKHPLPPWSVHPTDIVLDLLVHSLDCPSIVPHVGGILSSSVGRDAHYSF